LDLTRFDDALRSLTRGHSRRTFGTALSSFVLGAIPGSRSLVETEAKKKKRKKRDRRPNRVSPTCADGIKNGNESDVDCGGNCPRCANGKACLVRNDCAGAHCVNGTCQECSPTVQCGVEADGATCICRAPILGGPKFCTKGNSAGSTVTSCDMCAPGTICVGPVAGGFNCTRHCGAA
jgi:hypothetical protein